MKKILVLLLFLVPVIVFAEEEVVTINGVDEPQWKDFAPKAYIEVKAPRGLGKFNDTASYWYKRKVGFEKGIEKCREVEDSEMRFTCYQDLKVEQYQKNSDYNARLEAMENAKHMPQEMQDPTTNMFPIGGYLNNFGKFQPNEFR